jgi:hypothetical protein
VIFVYFFVIFVVNFYMLKASFTTCACSS